MTTLTKKELMEKINTLEWERIGYKKTIRKREAEKASMAATYKEKEEELMADWTRDSKKAIAYIHEIKNQNYDYEEEIEELKEAYEGLKAKHRGLEAKHEELKKYYEKLEQDYESMYNKRNQETDKVFQLKKEIRELNKLIEL